MSATGRGAKRALLCAAGTLTLIIGMQAGAPPVASAQDGDLERVLVLSKTAGFRHDSIPSGIAAIQQLGVDNGFQVDATEDAAQFNDANLAQYDAVIWLSTTGDVLDSGQQAAFQRYMQAGGGYVGIHSAADTEYDWAWYGEMLGGAYFDSHPPGTPAGSIDVEDDDEPSTAHLPARWDRTDEWYNYRANPRDAGLHVLARLDESTYTGGNMGEDHPIAWCTDFDGGRAWYTGGGHTQGSFSEPLFVEHILGGIRTAARDVAADCGEPRLPTAGEFAKVTLDDDTENPMELDIAPDGRVFYIERTGEVNVWKPDTESTVVAGEIPVYLGEENGLIGLTLAPDFEQSGWIYLTYSALPEETLEQRVSRFKVVGDQLDLDSEQVILTWTHQRETCCHSSGSLYFGPDGTLYVSTGDNTNPFESQGFTPIDERAGRQNFDAQRTSANTNDLNGKILRVDPIEEIAPGTAPGPGSTYEIPAGNLYPSGTVGTRPEIFAMGFRNPFRFTVDPETGWVLMADYGPDAPAGNALRGPQGSVEYNAVTEPGNYGWPYCVRENVAYIDYDFALSLPGAPFNCADPANASPNNTGLTDLPAAQPATMWMGYTDTDARFPELGTGGAPMGGPRYHFDPDNPSPTKFPEEYDGEWFIAEWNNNWIKTATLNDQGAATDVSPFPSLPENGGYKRPMDLDFGPDGSLYVIEWGSGFSGDNADSGVYRIDHVAGARAPVARATATPDNGPVPLEVSFSSADSSDPDGGALTYAWDFDGDGTTDSTEPNPTHTYAEPGAYDVRLTVTDEADETGVDNLQVVAGNTRPEVTIEIPQEGGFADFGERVPYELSVADAEEGSTEDGSIACDDVVLQVYLGHVSPNTGTLHTHPLERLNGCEGIFETLGESGHGPNENVFPVIEASYRDEGLTGGAGRLTGRQLFQLQPKRKQAEHFSTTGRAPDGTGGGDPGVQTETTTDAGGGLNIGFTEDGDYVSYGPVNFANIDALTFRVASGGAGGTIEVRLDSPTGEQVASANVAPTGGWQTWVNVTAPITDPGGTHDVFLVFRNPTNTGGLMNLNWFEAEGRGVAVTARPKVTVAADPQQGTAPLAVQFDGEATDPDGEPGDELTYEWDFGLPGDADTSTEPDPSFTYEEPGTYTAELAVTDPLGGVGRASVEIDVDAVGSCDPGGRSDEFDGSALDPDRWQVIRPDDTNPFSVSGGELHLPIDNGSIYGPGTSARNIIVQPLPEGEVAVTAKITADELTENYHQAGLRVYADDDNWASVHMIHAGGQRDFEFIYESNGNPRNEAADKLGGIPADAPLTYYVRLISDGSQLTAEYSYDGETFEPVGRPASLDTFVDPKIGPAALSDAAPSVPVAHFDWIRFDPDGSGGGGADTDDQFDGTSLDTGRWNAIVRGNPDAYDVADGALTITTEPGDIYTSPNTDPPPNNFILQSAERAGTEWTIETKVSATIDGGYSQGGLIAYTDHDNYVKFDPISDQGQTRINRIELRSESAGAIQEPQPQVDVPEGTTEVWLRLTKTAETYAGEYSLDGETWTPMTAQVSNPMPAPGVGVYAFGVQQGGDTVSFDYFTHDGNGENPCECTPAGDEFDGSSLDVERWNSIVRHEAGLYSVADGALNVTTVNGDIYTAGDPSSTRNFFLQSADHAGADWTIETKLDPSELSDGYEQGGLLVYEDDANYVKFDVLSDQDTTAINRIELRSEENEVIQEPQPQVTPLPAGIENVWLRLTKSADMYSGEYSFDGETWTALDAAVQNDAVEPRFGLFTLGVNSGGGRVAFDYFAVDGSTGCPDPDPENSPPTIESATAEPSIGFAPLGVQFSAAASDADGDELTYSWDFDGDGTEDSSEQNPTHTYTEPGEHEAELTVSDGEAERTRTVSVAALESDDPEASFRTLAFSRTAGFRHSSIDEGHAALEQLGDQEGFQVDHSEDPALFRADVLSHYDTIVFLSTTGDVLGDQQQAAFEEYIRGGGGYVGIHSASDTEYDWTWYGHLVGGYFRNHPANQTATIDVEDSEHPSTAGLPPTYDRLDEWYNFKSPEFATVGDARYSPRGAVHVLATVDEATYSPEDGNTTADDHPVTWCQRYDGGRSWYTAMGHTEESFTEANFLAQVLGGLETTAGVEPSASCGVDGGEPPGPGPGGPPPDGPPSEPPADAPGRATLRLSVKPSRAAAAPGDTATFTAKVRNGGEAAASDVRVCAKGPKAKLQVTGKDCAKIGALAAGAGESVKFKLLAKRSAAGKRARISFTASSSDARTARDQATLEIEP
jgi:cytochrome c